MTETPIIPAAPLVPVTPIVSVQMPKTPEKKIWQPEPEEEMKPVNEPLTVYPEDYP
jgi:hypothetical protein